jgi:uncharacterized protein
VIPRSDACNSEHAPAPWRERAVLIDCHGDTLVAITTTPSTQAVLGVVIVVGGPQYRVGSHRQFVVLARALAQRGIAAMRFDVRGMGDATGDQRDFEAIGDDIVQAVTAMRAAVPTLERVVLLGLCDGASAALMHVDRFSRGSRAITDGSRVDALVLLNPWVRSPQGLARTQVRHYYGQRLRERAFWLKLLRGGVSWRAPMEWASKVISARRVATDAPPGPSDARSFVQRMADGWVAMQGPVWLVLSGRDYTAKEFEQAWNEDPAWQSARQRGATRRLDLGEADHTMSTAAHWQLCIDWIVGELRAWSAEPFARP